MKFLSKTSYFITVELTLNKFSSYKENSAFAASELDFPYCHSEKEHYESINHVSTCW